MKKLIERVEKYKSLKDDQLQAKLKAKALAIERKEIRVDHPPPRPWRDIYPQGPQLRLEVVKTL